MSNSDGGQQLARTDADGRRWLIGIGISIAFGLFGAVMALLSYADRNKPSPPPAVQHNTPAAVAPPAAAAPEAPGPQRGNERGSGKGHGHK